MPNIADLKSQILEARSAKDFEKELNLTKKLINFQGESKKILTIKDVYAQLANSP